MKKLCLIIILFIPLTTIASVKINEFSPADKVSDWVEITADEDLKPDNLTIDLNEKTIFAIDSMKLKAGEKRVLYFNSSAPNQGKKIFTKTPDLPLESGQLTLKINNQILDKVCWSTKKNSDCLKSGDLKTGYSFGRNNQSTWTVFIHPTPGKDNLIINKSPQAKISYGHQLLSGSAPFVIKLSGLNSNDADSDPLNYFWNFGDGQTSNLASPPSHVFTNPGTYEVSLKVADILKSYDETRLKIKVAQTKNQTKNQTFSQTASASINISDNPSQLILLTEIMPNPKGQDAGQEWLEIYNNQNVSLNLSGWKIITGLTKKKSTTLKNLTIGSKKYYVIKNISFLNQKNIIELVTKNNQLIDSLSYDQVKENQSYSRENANKDSLWNWTETPTPGQSNPAIISYTGLIKNPTDQSFELVTDTGSYEIRVPNLPPAKLKNTFLNDTTIKIIGQKITDQTILLKNYQIIKTPPPPKKSTTIIELIIISLTSIGLVFLFFYQKKQIPSNPRA